MIVTVAYTALSRRGVRQIADTGLGSAFASPTVFGVNDDHGIKQDLGHELRSSREIEFLILLVVDASGVRPN